MTVRHLVRRAWLATFISGGAALSTFGQSPAPLPPLPVATPVVPPAESLPPLPGATPAAPVVPAGGGTTPVIPPPGTTPAPMIVPAVPPPSETPPVIAPPTGASVPPAPPMAPAGLPMMSPMPTAAPELPPMGLPGGEAPKPSQKIPPTNPMAPATPPKFEETPAASKPAVPVIATASATVKPTTEVKIGKPAIDGQAAYAMMLAEAKIAYAKVSDYSGHVVHQDRIKGQLTGDQTAEIRVKTKPNSISLRYVAPTALMGKELIHVAGRNVGKVRIKPAGSFGPGGFLSVELNDARATAHTRHTAVEFGIGPMIELLTKQLTVEQRLRNAVQVSISDYTYAGRQVSRFEVYTDRAHALRYAYRTVIYVDKETKLPIRMEAYDQPTVSGSPTGELMESYSYVNLKFNQGIGDVIFEK